MKNCKNYFFSLSIFLIAFVSVTNAQNPSINWAVKCGNSGSDKTLDLSLDQSGNIYACGYYNNDGNFGPLYLNTGTSSKEAFITKLDSAGNFIWAVSGGGYLDDRTLGICNDLQGNVIATGTFWSNSNFGPFPLIGSADHIFITKIDPNGNFLWATTGGSSGDDHGYDLVTDSQGNIFITGYLSNHYGPTPGTASFGTLPTFPVWDSIAFVAKMSSAGIWQWVKTFGGTDVERDNDIVLDSLGNIYIAGGFYGTKNFGTTTLISTNNSRDIFVIKYDPNWNFVWVRSTGSPLDDRANGITIDHEQHLYITGEFRDYVNFGLDTLNNYGGPGGRDIFVVRMDLDGTWVWAKRAGSTSGGDAGRGITVNRNGNIFVTGQCKGLVKFGNDTILNTGTDSIQAFVAAIDSLGDWKWALHAGGPLEDRGYGIEVDASCRLYFCGYFDIPTAQFGTQTLTSYGRKDGFMSRIDGGCFEYDLVDVNENSINDFGCNPRMSTILSPNGDVSTQCISVQDDFCIESMSCVFYNSWGQIVYQTSNQEFCWTGTNLNGQLLPSGVYYYLYQGKVELGKGVMRKGIITLVL